MTMRRAFVVVVVLVLCVSVVSAAGTSLQIAGGTIEETFDDGDLQEYDGVVPSWSTQTETVANGSHSLQFNQSKATESSHIIRSNESTTLGANESFTVSFWYRAAGNTVTEASGFSCGGVCGGIYSFELGDGAKELRVERVNDGVDDTRRFRVRGNLLDTEIEIGRLATDEWHQIEVSVDYTSDTVTLTVDGTDRGTSSINGAWQNPNNVTLNWRATALTQINEPADFFFDTVSVEAQTTSTLELDIEPFMEHGTDQTYEVTEVVTNLSTGKTTRTDVTDTATVTSSNTSLVSVQDTTNTLFATTNEDLEGTVEITATNDGLTDTVNVTVSNKSLDNIASLPPPTWPSAIFGSPGGTTGSSGAWPGAVQLQWLFVCLVVGAIVSWKSGHALLGVGVAEVMLAFGWAIAWVSDGVLIASIIFVVYAALAIGDVASGGMAEG